MTIDEKIQDFRQLEYDFEHSMCDTEDEKENLMKYQQEYEYYKQLAEWLEELKAYKEKEFDVLKQDGQLLYKNGVIDGYNKAIDDFAETIKTSQEAHLWYCSDYGLEFCNGDNCEECSHEFTKQIDKIAEQLKVGGTDE